MFWLKVLSEPVRLKPLAILIWDRLITCVQVSVVLNLIPMLVTCISFVTRIQPLCINAEAIFFSMKSTWDVTTRNTHHAAVVPDVTWFSINSKPLQPFSPHPLKSPVVNWSINTVTIIFILYVADTTLTPTIPTTQSPPFKCPGPDGLFPVSPSEKCSPKYYACINDIPHEQVGLHCHNFRSD